MAVGSELPPGFTVDSPPPQQNYGSQLPPGFTPDPAPNAMPDMSGIHAMATKNMQPPEKGEISEAASGEEKEAPPPPPFSAKLDQAVGMQVSGALGNPKNNATLTPDIRGHLMDSYGKGTSTSLDDFMHSVLHTVVPIAAMGIKNAQEPFKPIIEGMPKGIEQGYQNLKNFATMADLPTPVLNDLKGKLAKGEPVNWKEYLGTFNEGFMNSPPGQAMGAVFNTVGGAAQPAFDNATKILEAGGIPKEVTQLIMNLSPLYGARGGYVGAEFPEGAGPWDKAPTEFKEMVGNKLNKSPAEVTDNDISQAIRMGFEDKAPRAEDFKNAATTMLGHAEEDTGATSLRNIYKDTSVPPDRVFEDARTNPDILSEVRAGKIPAAYESLVDKSNANNIPHVPNEFSGFASKYDQTSGGMNQAAKDFVNNKGKETGHEHIIALDDKGQAISYGTSKLPAFVEWPQGLVDRLTDPEGAIDAHHNHPIGTALSPDDITALAGPGLKSVSAHTPDGFTSKATLTEGMKAGLGDRTSNEQIMKATGILKKIAQDADNESSFQIQKMVNAKELAPSSESDHLGIAATDIKNRALAKAGVIDYTSSHTLNEFTKEQYDSIISKTVEAIRKRLDSYGLRDLEEGQIKAHDDYTSSEEIQGRGTGTEKITPALLTEARNTADIHEADFEHATPQQASAAKAIIEDEVNKLINAVPEIKDALVKTVKGIVGSTEKPGESGGSQPAESVVTPKPSAERASRGTTWRKSRAAAAIGEPEPIAAADTGTGNVQASTAEFHSPADMTPEHQELEESLGVPETMTASQLGKLDKKIGNIFANKGTEGLPKAADLSDDQFQALEDYGRRVEKARESIASTPIKSFIKDETGSFQIPDEAKDFVDEIKKEVLNFATPMETGSPRARAAAKDFANSIRKAQYKGALITNLLTERFSPEELKGMWEAMDKASVHAQTLEANGMSRELAMAKTEQDGIGHFALPEEQKEIIKAMSDWASHTWDQAKGLGMVDGEGLPFWTPRMAAAIGEDGAWGAPEGEHPSVDIGHNLRTSAGSLKQRKYLTAEETEAAMKKKFGGEEGDGAQLVRDIRTMPLALARLQQAIGGRSLIQEIKNLGKDTGADTVSESKQDGSFTLDHPAFQTYRPRLKINDEGKWEVQKDADGNDLFDKVPLYVSKEFEGPLKAVLSQKSGAAYKALMALKGKSMSLIMYSPVIHNAVEYGRALPAMPGKVITGKVYFEGNRIKNDPKQMEEAIDAGLVPIGSRFFNQDISSVIEQPNLTPGRSWEAKLLGGIVGEVSPEAGEAVKSAIDKAGDVWHNTLLWDRVADLQMGLYGNIRDKAADAGMVPQAAQSAAAHIANRFAGALPMESMGNWARKIANVVMFSRSFTIGNLGVMKDMFKGLPSDVMAQLERDVGPEQAKMASNFVQRKAISAFAMDIALLYVGNSILQDTIDHLKRDKSLGQIAQGYVNRIHALLQKHAESPWELLNIPGDLAALSSTSTNEPGKENRILFSHDPEKGTNYYMRFPTGKIGEEFEGWLTSPNEMAHKKLSPQISPLMDIYKNEDYFGHPIYDKNARGISGMAGNIGAVVKHFMEAQIPTDAIQSAYKDLTGTSNDKALDYMKVGGPLVGLTFSKGYPGGPEAGILAATSRRHEVEVSETLPKIKDAIESHNEDKARELMDSLGMPPREQAMLIRHYLNPQDKVNARSLRKFEQTATPEEKELMDQQSPGKH